MAATYLTLPLCRDHLNIKDLAFTEDDDYIMLLAESAEISVEKSINQTLVSLETEVDSGVLPEDLMLALKFLMATWYDHRENIVKVITVTEFPYAMNYILQPYMKRAIA